MFQARCDSQDAESEAENLRNMLTGVMVDVVGTTAQLEQEALSLKTLKRDIAEVATGLVLGC